MWNTNDKKDYNNVHRLLHLLAIITYYYNKHDKHKCNSDILLQQTYNKTWYDDLIDVWTCQSKCLL
jgi:hypothetical protein